VSAALVALAAWLLWPHPAGPAKPTFVLLLYEDASFAAGRTERDLVAEYAAWARSLDRRGALVMGEKLGETSHRLRGGNGRGGGPTVDRIQVTSDLGQLAGLFVIRADDEAAALAIARTCPHLRYGGSVVVRPVATS
jgi:hypothetical protein